MLKHKFYGASSNSKQDSTVQDKPVAIKITSPPNIESIEPENEVASYSSAKLRMDRLMDEKLDPTTMFRDGVRKIDYVLVIEDVKKKSQSNEEASETTTLVTDDDEETGRLRKKQRIDVWRQRFMGRILSQGIEVEEEVCEQEGSSLRFIKLHGPWKLLCKYAEDLNIEVPLQEIPDNEEEEFENSSEYYFSKLCIRNIMKQHVPNKPKQFYTSPFKLDKLNKFLGKDDPDTFFTATQRSRMVYEVLATTPFGKEKKGEIGIARLLNDGAYEAAFPLHDGESEVPSSSEKAKGNQVQPDP